MSSIHPPLPDGAGPATRELPVVPPTATGATAAGAAAMRETAPVEAADMPAPPAPAPPAPAAPTAQSAAAGLGPQPTGPVDYVPGPPAPGGPTTTPAPAVAPAMSRDDFFGDLLKDTPRRARDHQALRHLTATVLAIAALAVLELGLAVHEAGRALWSEVPLWSGFATLAALLGLAALATGLPANRKVPAARAWPAAAAGLVGLAVFWLLVVLPRAGTDRGFLLTAALGCLGGGVWLTAGRRSAATPPPTAGPRDGQPAQGA